MKKQTIIKTVSKLIIFIISFINIGYYIYECITKQKAFNFHDYAIYIVHPTEYQCVYGPINDTIMPTYTFLNKSSAHNNNPNNTLIQQNCKTASTQQYTQTSICTMYLLQAPFLIRQSDYQQAATSRLIFNTVVYSVIGIFMFVNVLADFCRCQFIQRCYGCQQDQRSRQIYQYIVLLFCDCIAAPLSLLIIIKIPEQCYQQLLLIPLLNIKYTLTDKTYIGYYIYSIGQIIVIPLLVVIYMKKFWINSIDQRKLQLISNAIAYAMLAFIMLLNVVLDFCKCLCLRSCCRCPEDQEQAEKLRFITFFLLDCLIAPVTLCFISTIRQECFQMLIIIKSSNFQMELTQGFNIGIYIFMMSQIAIIVILGIRRNECQCCGLILLGAIIVDIICMIVVTLDQPVWLIVITSIKLAMELGGICVRRRDSNENEQQQQQQNQAQLQQHQLNDLIKRRIQQLEQPTQGVIYV